MRYRIRFPQLDPHYDSLLSGILAFSTLDETEETLTRLDNLRQRFLAASDKKGVEYCRQIAMAGRCRAEMIARNQRVNPVARRLKMEAALWFQIWIETPDLFGDWLMLRKLSAEYRNLTAGS